MQKITLLIIFWLNSLLLFQQAQPVFHIDSVPPSSSKSRVYGLKLPDAWKYHDGDNMVWAQPSFSDSSWKSRLTILADSIGKNVFEGIGWFRLWLELDSSQSERPLGLLVEQYGASEFYLDGKLVADFGTINVSDPSLEKHYNPHSIPVAMTLKPGVKHLLAVRYACHTSTAKQQAEGETGFVAKIGRLNDAILFSYHGHVIITSFYIFYFTFFFALSFVHLMLFLYYKANRSNLFYSLFAGSFGVLFLFNTLMIDHTDPDFTRRIAYFHSYLPDLYIPALLAMLYCIFNDNKLPKIFWILLPLFVADFILTVFGINIPYLGIVYNLIAVIEPFRVIITAIIKKRDGAWIIGVGIISTIVFFALFFTLPFFLNAEYLSAPPLISMLTGILTVYFTLNIPLSMTVFLARDFAKTSKNLEKKLVEVEALSVKNLEQEKEKQKILETQKEVLEHKVTERTREISDQKKIIEEKNKDITDSILYAKRIQEALLPPRSFIKQHLPHSFIMYAPKDIVAGDFYWAERVSKHSRQSAIGQTMADSSVQAGRGNTSNSSISEEILFIAAADCTGHGVPGAMVSVVCATALNRAVKEFGITEPGQVLDKVRDLVIETFEKSGAEVKDGMDISLCSITQASGKIHVQWSGANNPLWYVQNGEVKEITAHKQPIGKTDQPSPFPTHSIELEAGDSIYLFTDGYADQFGGAKGKKFKYRQLQDLLMSSRTLSPEKLQETLETVFTEWKGNLEQVDDVTVIGIRF